MRESFREMVPKGTRGSSRRAHLQFRFPDNQAMKRIRTAPSFFYRPIARGLSDPHSRLAAALYRSVSSEKDCPAGWPPMDDHRTGNSLTMDARIPGTRRSPAWNAPALERLLEG